MTVLSAIVENEVFLQGKYLSIGVNSSGDIGTRYAAPKGTTTDSAYARIGLVADMDGFGTGSAAMRDAIVRGAPIEGYNIGYKTGGNTYIHSNQELDGLTEIAGKASNASTATVGEADWKGTTTEKLGVDQKITLTEDAKFIRFEVTLTNNSASTMSDLRYMRTVDPDMAANDSFATVNKVVKQGADGALITAAASATGNPMFLYANDPRAVVSSYGFINENPYAAAVATAQKVGTTTKTDMSINLNFDLGTLAVGAATKVVFYMGVTDNLAATIAEIDKLGNAPTKPPAPTNTAPDAINDTLAIVSGDTGKGNVLANDKDADGNALTAVLKTGASHGTVTLAADGSYVYKAAAGYVGADSFTYTASDGKASDSALVSITVAAPPAPTNAAPDAINDVLAIVATTSGTGNVLSNDKDANGDALTATLKTGPAHGTVSLAADGNYVYQAAAGYVGLDSFTYTASDGKASDTAAVAITVAAPPLVFPGLPDSPLLQRAGTLNGSAATADMLTGVSQHNSFYFDLGAKSGVDKITNFGSDDVLVTKGALLDGNGDGIIMTTKSKLSLDGSGGTDSVAIAGVTSLRYLGTEDGLSVYANAAVKPKGAIEGKISDDVLSGDARDLKKNVFFFDTALDIHLGDDTINTFGVKDLLVTTSALSTTSLGTSGLVKLVGGSGDASDTRTAGEAGTIDLNGVDGGAVQALEFDGSVNHGGVTYYVYSHVGSQAGVGDLVF